MRGDLVGALPGQGASLGRLGAEPGVVVGLGVGLAVPLCGSGAAASPASKLRLPPAKAKSAKKRRRLRGFMVCLEADSASGRPHQDTGWV